MRRIAGTRLVSGTVSTPNSFLQTSSKATFPWQFCRQTNVNRKVLPWPMEFSAQILHPCTVKAAGIPTERPSPAATLQQSSIGLNQIRGSLHFPHRPHFGNAYTDLRLAALTPIDVPAGDKTRKPDSGSFPAAHDNLSALPALRGIAFL